MRILKALLLLLSVNTIQVHAQVSYNTTLLGKLAPSGIYGYSDIWGYYDPVTGKEFAILCNSTTFMIDVSDPKNPTVVSTLGSSTDVKTFGHYVALNGGKIWDISNVYSPVLVTSNGVRGHNIYIDYPYGFGSGTFRNISNPSTPSHVGNFNGYSHDVMAFNDTVYYAGTIMRIFNFAVPHSPKLILEFGFPSGSSFAHSAFPTNDRNHLLIADETGPSGLSIWDISDQGDPTQVAQYGPFHDIPTVHNVYVKENYAYISHYVDGLRILDISDPTNPIEAGYYDTYPDSVDWFQGAWGVYPFAPSGNIYISDLKYGLFIVKFDSSDSLVKISGIVRDIDTGEPIAGAWSFVRGVYKGVSDSQGNFVFHAPKGAHKVITRMHSYFPDTTSVTLSHGNDVLVFPALKYEPPMLSFDRQSLNFEALEINNTRSDSLLITNSAGTSLQLSLSLSDSSGYVVDDYSNLLHPGISQILNITFTPSEADDYSGYLLISSEAGEDTIMLQGIGLDYRLDSESYRAPGIDSMIITAFLPSTSLRVFGLIQSMDSTIIDSIELFSAGDSIYSNSWPLPPVVESDYYVDLALYSADSSEIRFHGIERRIITSIGPIELESFRLLTGDSTFSPGETVVVSPRIINSGLSSTAFNIGAELSTGDSCVVNIFNRIKTLNDIAAGDTSDFSGLIGIVINENCPVNTDISLILSFLSNGVPFWEKNVTLHVSPVGVEDEYNNTLPSDYKLSQNHPNPFNPVTNISYSLPVAGDVTLIIYNLLGKEVARLIDGFQQAGKFQTEWNASNVSSGIYFYRLQTNSFTQTKKMVLLK